MLELLQGQKKKEMAATMCNFSLDGITTKLIPLDLNGIEDRIRWNTVSAEWKTIDDPNYTAQALNIALEKDISTEFIHHWKSTPSLERT